MNKIRREILRLETERDQLEDELDRMACKIFDQREELRDLVEKTKFQKRLLAAAGKDSARALKGLTG